MRDTIVSLNSEGKPVYQSVPMDLVDRLDFLSSTLNEFSTTLVDVERVHLFELVRNEYESMRSDLKHILAFVDGEERRERSESPQRADQAPQPAEIAAV